MVKYLNPCHQYSTMPRYPLIISNTNYMLLQAEASKRGVSLGKIINEILDQVCQQFEESQAGEPKDEKENRD